MRHDVSVVIPTRGRVAMLQRLVESLRVDVETQRAELIVVNDDVLGELTLPPMAQVLRGGGNGPANARNLGAAAAKGELLLFVDDDSVAPPGYLGRVIGAARRLGPGHAFAGPQHCLPDASPAAHASRTLLDWFTDIESIGERKFLPSNGLAVFRTDFERAGRFNTQFTDAAGEDREFCLRLRKAGVHLVYDPSIALLHEFPSTVSTFLRQQWRYGRGARQYSRIAERRSVAPRNLQCYVALLRGANLSGGLRNALLCLAAQGLVLAGFVWESTTEL